MFFYARQLMNMPVLADQPEIQSCGDTGYSLEDLPGAINARDGWRESEIERERDRERESER